MKLAARLAALEAIVERADNGVVIAWMIDGASDDDVVAVKVPAASKEILQRERGESLADLVKRAKALAPGNDVVGLLFYYSQEAKARLGKSERVDAAPNAWPDPSHCHAGWACHVEHRP